MSIAAMKRKCETLRLCATCADCEEYSGAPDGYARVPFGWCVELGDFVDAKQDASECDGLCMRVSYLMDGLEEVWI